MRNLGTFPVHGVVFRAEIWAVTRGGNQLVELLDLEVEEGGASDASRPLPPQASGSSCWRPQQPAANQVAAEDLSQLPQLVSMTSVSGGLEEAPPSAPSCLQNSSSGGASVAARCRLHLPASAGLRLRLRGRLLRPALLALSFSCLEVVATASIQMEASSPAFLQEDAAVREVLAGPLAFIWL